MSEIPEPVLSRARLASKVIWKRRSVCAATSINSGWVRRAFANCAQSVARSFCAVRRMIIVKIRNLRTIIISDKNA